MSASDRVCVWKSYTGTLTDMIFLVVCVSFTLCLGSSSACSSAWELMSAEATVKAPWTVISSSSTSCRRARTSRTVSRNCFISSSRLSFSSLWPRWAVRSLPFRRVSSIRVGLTVILGICQSPSFHPGLGARGQRPGASAPQQTRGKSSSWAAAKRGRPPKSRGPRKGLTAPSWASTFRYTPA